MRCSSTFSSALGALCLLASAGRAVTITNISSERALVRRDHSPGMVEVPLAEIQLLQAEYTAFRGMMTDYISKTDSIDIQAAQLKQDLLAYDMAITPFLSRYIKNSTDPCDEEPEPASSNSTATPPSAPSTNSSSKPFDAHSQGNLTVYYGQTPHSNKVTSTSSAKTRTWTS